jgi:CubicO group peptidase (beta-lactamase class C family)
VILTKVQQPFLWLSVVFIFCLFQNSKAFSDTNDIATEYQKIFSPLMEKKLLPGYYFAVFKDGEKVFEQEAGFADEKIGLKATSKTIYAIASMSKPLTTLGMILLAEKTALSLDDPISKYLPEFSDMLVAEGGSYDGQLIAASRNITIFDLLTHTSGLTYSSEIIGVGDIANAYRDLEIFSLASSVTSETGDLRKHTRKLSELALVAQPGNGFNYSTGIDVAGRIIEVASGKNLQEYLKQNIFIPLNMNDTDFVVRSESQKRLARLYAPLKRTYQIPGTPKMYQESILLPKEFKNIGVQSDMFSGGAGLVSTGEDYSKFLNFLIERDKNNPLALSQNSFDLILQDQLGAKFGENLMVPNFGKQANKQIFSLGLGVFLDDDATSMKESDYDYLGWGGAYNTQFWIDPKNRVAGIFLTQMYPARFRLTEQLEDVADQFLSQ